MIALAFKSIEYGVVAGVAYLVARYVIFSKDEDGKEK
jgi:hypothetical protein